MNIGYDYDFDGVRPNPILLLRPTENKGAETVTYLSENDNGRIIGPYPPGDYLASVVTMAAKTRKKYVSVSIENNKTKEINFVFTPDGVIRGCVVMPLQLDDKVVGMPDYYYRLVDRKIQIQSITLKGNGLHRVLYQIEGEDNHNLDWAISRNDICYNKCFGFFGLSAGEYKLSIKAKGFKPHEKIYSVMPGVPKYFRVTELTPE